MRAMAQAAIQPRLALYSLKPRHQPTKIMGESLPMARYYCAVYCWPMGYNARNDEIRDNITRMRQEWEAQRGALATVRRVHRLDGGDE